jgi:hypothetical protein
MFVERTRTVAASADAGIVGSQVRIEIQIATDAHRQHRRRPSALRFLPCIARWRRDLAKTAVAWQPYAFGRWRCGCLAILTPRSQTQSKRSGRRATSAKPSICCLRCSIHR